MVSGLMPREARPYWQRSKGGIGVTLTKYAICHIGPSKWYDFKVEAIHGLYFSLLRLGRDVTIEHNRVDKSRLNILIGADFLAGNNESTNNIISQGFDYVIFEIEKFDGNSINSRKKFNIELYLSLIQSAQFVITPYKYNVRTYEAAGFSEKIRYLKWGLFPELVIPGRTFKEEKIWDACFFGLPKGTRKQTLDELSTKMKLKVLGPRDPIHLRDYVIARSKYGLSLNYGPEEAFVNPFRIFLFLANNLPVLSDSKNDEDDYLGLTTNVQSIKNFCSTIKSGTERENERAKPYLIDSVIGHL